MNATGELLSAREVAELRAQVNALATDANVGQTVTLYPASTRTRSFAAGTVNYGGIPVSFRAVCGPAKVDDSAGIVLGDMEILVSLAEATPAVHDQIQIGSGVLMAIKLVEPDPVGGMISRVIAGRVP